MSLLTLRNGYVYSPEYNFLTTKKSLRYIEKANLERARTNEYLVNKKIIENNMYNFDRITFEMTQDCNLRCAYCVYNKHYMNSRKRTKAKMDYETARKAILYLKEYLINSRKNQLYFTFYGGEAIINIHTIYKIVSLIERVLSNRTYYFALNTNATLLTAEIINYLIAHNFRLTISLDGPKEVHDAKRLMKSGRGSYDLVVRNLEMIRGINSNYYYKNITFSIVWSPDLPIADIYNYYRGYELVNKNRCTLTFVKSTDTDYLKYISHDRKKAMSSLTSIKNAILRDLKEGKKVTPIERKIFDAMNLQDLDKKNIDPLLGACLIGQVLYLDSFGRFHICHLVSDRYPIGDVDNGLDFAYMEVLSNEYMQVLKNYCYSCSYRYLCDRCFKNFLKADGVKIDKNFCKSQRMGIRAALNEYCEVQNMGLGQHFNEEG